MAKLYSKETTPSATLSPVLSETPENTWPAQEQFDELANYTAGYCSVSTLYDSIACESYTLVDAKNRHLFNAYVDLLSQRLGVPVAGIRKVDTHALESQSTVAVNSEIAIEGWIGTLWDKIKSVFKSMYNKIKEFFKRHFTRLGRVKKALENLIKVLDKTDKNMKDPQMEDYTGKLLKTYAGYGEVSSPTVRKSLVSIATLNTALVNINKEATVIAEKHMVDKDFFDRMKNLLDRAKAAGKVREDVNEGRESGLGSNIPGTNRNKSKKEKDKEMATLAAIADSSTKEAAAMDTVVGTNQLENEDNTEANKAKGKSQYDAFMEEVKKQLSVNLDKPLISGKVITKVEVKDDGDVDITMEDKGDDCTSIVLGTKTDTLALSKDALKLIESSEKELDAFGKVNDVINKNLMAIDKLVVDIDKVDPEKYGAYKKLINEQVRERLTLLRRFFTIYNKVGKNVLDLTMDACDGVVDYSVLSLKKFS